MIVRRTTRTQMASYPQDTSADGPSAGLPAPMRAPRSHYHLSRQEWIQGIANRFVFSQIYLYLYLSMALLSLTTVVLSLLSECPTAAFYVLEMVVNVAMIVEVGLRLVAFGKRFWTSFFNWLDLVITGICVVTVGVTLVQGCGAKKEEVLETLLLVVRNGLQFVRLALMVRRSGKNIFSTIQPIDLESAIAHADAHAFFLDLDDEDLRRPPPPSHISPPRLHPDHDDIDDDDANPPSNAAAARPLLHPSSSSFDRLY